MPSDFKRTVCEERVNFIAIAFDVLPSTLENLRFKIDTDTFNDEFGVAITSCDKDKFIIGFTLPVAHLKAKWRNKTPEQIADRLLERLKRML